MSVIFEQRAPPTPRPAAAEPAVRPSAGIKNLTRPANGTDEEKQFEKIWNDFMCDVNYTTRSLRGWKLLVNLAYGLNEEDTSVQNRNQRFAKLYLNELLGHYNTVIDANVSDEAQRERFKTQLKEAADEVKLDRAAYDMVFENMRESQKLIWQSLSDNEKKDFNEYFKAMIGKMAPGVHFAGIANKMFQNYNMNHEKNKETLFGTNRAKKTYNGVQATVENVQGMRDSVRGDANLPSREKSDKLKELRRTKNSITRKPKTPRPERNLVPITADVAQTAKGFAKKLDSARRKAAEIAEKSPNDTEVNAIVDELRDIASEAARLLDKANDIFERADRLLRARNPVLREEDDDDDDDDNDDDDGGDE